MRSALMTAAALAAMAGSAASEPAALDPDGARSIGRAGVGLVSDDSGLVLLANPAGIARRGGQRLSAGLRLAEIDTEIDGGARAAADQSGPALLGSLGYVRSLGDRWVLAAAVAETAEHRRQWPAPAFGQPADDVADLFFYRYGGLSGAAVKRTATAGAAVRAAEWLAVGAALRLSTLSVSETRAVWAGFSGREPVGSAERDLLLAVDGETLVRPGAAIGALAAPIDIPIEIAAGVAIDAPASLSGSASLSPTTDAGVPPSPGAGGDASIEHPALIVAATGLRYLGSRVIAEVNAELSMTAGADPRWRFDPITVTDESGATGELAEVAPLLEVRSQYALRGAVDVAAVSGFLWLTAGYSLTSASTGNDRRGPLQSAGQVHRVAAGVEALWSGFTVTVGYARELSAARAVGDDTASVPIINPFDAGTGPATAGRYRRSADLGGLRIEYAWE